MFIVFVMVFIVGVVIMGILYFREVFVLGWLIVGVGIGNFKFLFYFKFRILKYM